MPQVQDFIGTYDTQHRLGFAGMLAESQIKDVASKVVENEDIAFGLAVGAGEADGSVSLDGAGFEGIAIADKSRPADLYAVGEVAGVIRKGTVWVTATTAVTPADPVTFTAATGEIGAGLDETIEGAKFETTAEPDDLVRVYLG